MNCRILVRSARSRRLVATIRLPGNLSARYWSTPPASERNGRGGAREGRGGGARGAWGGEPRPGAVFGGGRGSARGAPGGAPAPPAAGTRCRERQAADRDLSEGLQ